MEDEEQRLLALDHGWFLVGEMKAGKPLGYRLVRLNTGAKVPGHDSEGLVTLDEVEAFLTKNR